MTLMASPSVYGGLQEVARRFTVHKMQECTACLKSYASCTEYQAPRCAPVEAEEGRHRADDADLDGYEANQQRQHDVPLMQQQADVHAGTRSHKEQPQQHPSERPDVCLNLHMPDSAQPDVRQPAAPAADRFPDARSSKLTQQSTAIVNGMTTDFLVHCNCLSITVTQPRLQGH